MPRPRKRHTGQSDEHMAKMREIHAAKKEAQKQADELTEAAGLAVSEGKTVLPEQLDLSGEFAQAFRFLQQAQHTKHAQDAVDLLKQALGVLNDEDWRRIQNEPWFQELQEKIGRAAADERILRPGQEIVDGRGRKMGKVPWTWEYMLANPEHEHSLEMVEWTPTTNENIIVNGVGIYVYAHQPVKTPRIFRDVYVASKRDTDRATEDAVKRLKEQFGADIVYGEWTGRSPIEATGVEVTT